MRHKRVSGSSLTPAGRTNSSNGTHSMPTPLRAYAGLCAIVIAFLLFRFLILAETVHSVVPESAPESAKQTGQACWQTDINATAGAPPCHDPGVHRPEGNAKVCLFAPLRAASVYIALRPCCPDVVRSPQASCIRSSQCLLHGVYRTLQRRRRSRYSYWSFTAVALVNCTPVTSGDSKCVSSVRHAHTPRPEPSQPWCACCSPSTGG